MFRHKGSFLESSWEKIALCPLRSVQSKGTMCYISEISDNWVSSGFVHELWPWAHCRFSSSDGEGYCLNQQSLKFFEFQAAWTNSYLLEDLGCGTQGPFRTESATWWFNLVSEIFHFLLCPANPVDNSSLDLQDGFFPQLLEIAFKMLWICALSWEEGT